MPNQLANENSPYLLQHADNPVDWYPWGSAALEKARKEDKPIFLSIGYAACHWCHVMAHESFEDSHTASFLNQYFISIKVDREERPDLDGIYMDAVVAMTGHGGWPMSVFLTPDGAPFYGGTYFPPVRRYNLPAFLDVLQTIQRMWVEDRGTLQQHSRQLKEHLQSATVSPDSTETPLTPALLDNAALALAQNYDWQDGGWGRAPKFPQPQTIEFLLRRASKNDQLSFEIATHALLSMSKGGMYDVIGGGFSRYSTDSTWLVPHFEKMLYDNAQLALAYLHAFQVTAQKAEQTGNQQAELANMAKQFREVCESTLDFVLREMTHPAGGFYSSIDADSAGQEGLFYVWTETELRTLLADDTFKLFSQAYSVTTGGNFEGYNVLQRRKTDAELAEEFDISLATAQAMLQSARKTLFAERQKRIRPGTDDKVLVSWNALMSIAFVEASRVLDRQDYYQAAVQNVGFVITNMRQGKHILRSWRNGTALHSGYSEDYAGLVLALLALYQTDGDTAWFQEALTLMEVLEQEFSDPVSPGFFDTGIGHEKLLIRPKTVQDNAVPSGNALAAAALLQLSALTGMGRLRDTAEAMFRLVLPALTRYPTAFAYWMNWMDFATSKVHEIALLYPVGAARIFEAELRQRYLPNIVIASATFPPPPTAPQLLADRPLLDNLPTAYVCSGFVCQKPVKQVTDLLAQLA